MNQSQYSAIKLGRGYTILGSESNRNLNELDSTFENILSTSRTEPLRVKPIQHEMGVGSDNIKVAARDAGTDSANLVHGVNFGCMTRVQTMDSGTTNHIEVMTASS